jgi:hypothetical protein
MMHARREHVVHAQGARSEERHAVIYAQMSILCASQRRKTASAQGWRQPAELSAAEDIRIEAAWWRQEHL